jgi:hypothetical protein
MRRVFEKTSQAERTVAGLIAPALDLLQISILNDHRTPGMRAVYDLHDGVNGRRFSAWGRLVCFHGAGSVWHGKSFAAGHCFTVRGGAAIAVKYPVITRCTGFTHYQNRHCCRVGRDGTTGWGTAKYVSVGRFGMFFV